MATAASWIIVVVAAGYFAYLIAFAGLSSAERRRVYVMAALLRNGFSAQYNNSVEQTPSIGEDLDQYAVGINHNF